MKIYDIFTDASVDKSLRGACPGAIAVDRSNGGVIMESYMIQPEGTNNSGEIAAIWLGVQHAKKLLRFPKPFGEEVQINLFSDSLISVKGMRDWLFKWMDLRRGNILYKGDGTAVLNQNFHKLIFNDIIFNDIKIRFFHVRGHMTQNSMAMMMETFNKENEIPISIVGDPEYIRRFNDSIDKSTRATLVRYNEGKPLAPNTTEDRIYNSRSEFVIVSEPYMVDKYRWLIGKTRIRPDII